ncbi:MAG: DUF2723 domain-containing protein [Candidatus Eremiobacteraeota bacterium]|nr:DUF2723 domain-containing protein [Candidatus Eremiobacteraeota bacterium]
MSPWAALSFAVPFVLYVASLSPYVSAWDTAEFQTVPYIFGIAHPTGFPAFIMAGWIFTHLVPLQSVAWRMGLFSALCMSLSGVTCYVLCRRLAVSPPGACGAALLFAVGNVAWTRGTRAEVHSLAALLVVASALFALCWYQERRPRWLVLCAVASGVGLATHPTIVLAFPGIALLVIAAREMPSRRVIIVCLAALILPSLAYAYIPLRSHYVTAHRVDPTLALGIPPGRPYWDYGDPSTPQAFLRYVSGSDFRASASVLSLLDPRLYVRIAPRAWADLTGNEFPLVALVIAAFGAVMLAVRRPLTFAGLALALLISMPFAYGYEAEADPARYALPAFLLISVLVAYGVMALAGFLAGGDRRAESATVAFALFVLAGAEFWLQRDVLSQRFDRRFADYVDRVRQGTPANAVLVADWSYATPLAYAAFVERSLGERVVETAHPDDDRALLRKLAARKPVFVIAPADVLIPGVTLRLRSAGDPNLYEVIARK